MKIYLIPGLGYDHRIYQHLDFPGHEVEYINWIDPKEKESIQNYTQRLFAGIPNDQEKKVLVGHSFGAVVAQEFAAVSKVDMVIVLSSIRSREEMPRSMKWVKPVGIYRLFTKKLCIKTVKYWGKSHGFESKVDQEMFKSMIRNQSNNYLQWAFKTISAWQTPTLSQGTKIVQLHGSKDKTFPLKLIESPSHVIEGGDHIMLYRRPLEINGILNSEIENIS